MGNILDLDTVFIFAIIIIVQIAELTPYFKFALLVIAILVGITKLIQFYFWLKDRRKKDSAG
ncbi:MAG: hypothetical protein FVQ77_07190 [Cytophagales bacterium]|nr:hypothetical protein [Cytophagales bacterium]